MSANSPIGKSVVLEATQEKKIYVFLVPVHTTMFFTVIESGKNQPQLLCDSISEPTLKTLDEPHKISSLRPKLKGSRPTVPKNSFRGTTTTDAELRGLRH